MREVREAHDLERERHADRAERDDGAGEDAVGERLDHLGWGATKWPPTITPATPVPGTRRSWPNPPPPMRGPSPAVGSSSMSKVGSVIRARAIASICRSPPESARARSARRAASGANKA